MTGLTFFNIPAIEPVIRSVNTPKISAIEGTMIISDRSKATKTVELSNRLQKLKPQVIYEGKNRPNICKTIIEADIINKTPEPEG